MEKKYMGIDPDLALRALELACKNENNDTHDILAAAKKYYDFMNGKSRHWEIVEEKVD